MSCAESMPDIDPGTLANNYMQVMMLQTALSRSESNLTTVPRLVLRIIREDAWREWLSPEGNHVKWNAADFRRFLTEKRPLGCETPIHIIERTLRGTDAWEPFQELIRGEPGGIRPNQPRNEDGMFISNRNRDNVTIAGETLGSFSAPSQDIIPFDPAPDQPPPKRDYSHEAPTGNSVSYALRRLKTNGRDDLLEKVKAGEISAYAAKVQAGLVKREFSIPIEPQGAARRILNRFQGDQLVELVRVLANHAGIEIVIPE